MNRLGQRLHRDRVDVCDEAADVVGIASEDHRVTKRRCSRNDERVDRMTRVEAQPFEKNAGTLGNRAVRRVM